MQRRKEYSLRLQPNLQIKSISIITFKFTNSRSHDELISAWAMMSKWPWSHCRKILLLWTVICLGFWTIWNWSNRTCNIQVRTLWLANKFLLCAYLWKPIVHWKMNQTKTTKCRSKKIAELFYGLFCHFLQKCSTNFAFLKEFCKNCQTNQNNLAISYFSTQ